MVYMFEHAPFTNDIPNALGPYDFIFPYVFESKRQAGIFPLDDSHFTKGSSADDSKKAEMIEVHFAVEINGLALTVAHSYVQVQDQEDR